MKLFGIIVLGCVLSFIGYAQTSVISNSERMEQLIDSSIISNVKTTDFSEIKIVTPNNFVVFNSFISSKLSKKKSSFNGANALLVYTVEDAGIVYSEVLSDMIGDDLRLVRKAFCSGNIYLEHSAEMYKFRYSITDTIDYASKDAVSSNSYSILNPSTPTSSIFSSIWEPAAIIAALGVAFYLLFTVRKTN